jgi:hypothetical protein
MAQDYYRTTNSDRARINWLTDRRWDKCHVGRGGVVMGKVSGIEI